MALKISLLLSSCFLLLVGVVCVQGESQGLTSPPGEANSVSETDRLLDRLVENVTRNRIALPSLTAHESIVTKFDETVFFGRKGDKAEATVRLVRKSADSPEFDELRQITTLNGKAIRPGQDARLVISYVDDFDDYQSFAFGLNHRGCFLFSLAPHPGTGVPLLLSISPRPNPEPLPDCLIAKRGFTGTASIDPASYQISHFEFTTLDGQFQSRLTASIDYAPAKVGEKSFWLPTTFDLHWSNPKAKWEWHSRYSDYHQYSSSVKILPETQTP
jgi:hypothetical protein